MLFSFHQIGQTVEGDCKSPGAPNHNIAVEIGSKNEHIPISSQSGSQKAIGRSKKRGMKRTGNIVQQPVFIPVHRPGPHNRRILEILLHSDLSLGFTLIKEGRRIFRGIEMRDVDESRDTRFSGDSGDTFCACNVDIFKVIVPEKQIMRTQLWVRG